jgi:hypothetical protein
MSDSTLVLIFLLILAAFIVGVMLGLTFAPPRTPHPDIERIQRPLHIVKTEDIERRET